MSHLWQSAAKRYHHHDNRSDLRGLVVKFSISQAELQSALAVVSKGAAAHSTLPILAGVHLHTEDDALVLQTTDLDRSIQYRVPALVEDPGEVVQMRNQALIPYICIGVGALALIGGIISIVKAMQKIKRLRQQEEEWGYGN